MRRSEKEVADRAAVEAIIRRTTVCRLALCQNNRPYIVPLCFGYEDNTLYFHSANEGMKLDMLRENPHVCFEFDVDCEVVRAEEPCQWGMNYRSVIGFGKASFVRDIPSKRHAFDVIMGQYADGSFDFPETSLAATAVIKVDIERMTGKQSGY